MTFTVQLSQGAAIEVYAGLPAVDDYLFGSNSKGAAKYNALAANSDARKRLLVDATRYIDRKRWQGTRNGAGGTTLQFPRNDLTLDGVAINDADQLAIVNEAVCELVAVLAASQSAYSQADTSSNIAAMGAGSARVEFFKPTSTSDGSASELPTVVDELIGQWLSGGTGAAVSLGGSSVTASSASYSNFDNCGTDRNDPL
jgi:DnaT-like ssDNA binding protein